MNSFNGTPLTTSNMNNLTNFITADPLAALDDANRRFTKTLIPCIVYAGVLMLTGIIGNSLVCYVFGVRLKRCTQHYFILFLAVFDLLSCTIGLPAEIADMALQFKFTSAALCKTMRLVNTFSAMASVMTLIALAIDRYRRIRKPLKSQIEPHHARLSVIPILVITFFFASPSLYVYGLRTVESGVPGVTGLDCTISDESKGTIVPLVYNSCLFVCFIILAVSLIVMYSLILRSLKKHVETMRRGSAGTLCSGNDSQDDHCQNILSSLPSESDHNPSENQNKFDQLCDSSTDSSKNTLSNTGKTITEPKDENEGNENVDILRPDPCTADADKFSSIIFETTSAPEGGEAIDVKPNKSRCSSSERFIKHPKDFPKHFVNQDVTDKNALACTHTPRTDSYYKSHKKINDEPILNTDFFVPATATCHSCNFGNKKSKTVSNQGGDINNHVNHHVSFDDSSMKPANSKYNKKKQIINISCCFLRRQRRLSVTPIFNPEDHSQSYSNSAFSDRDMVETPQESKQCDHLDIKKQRKESMNFRKEKYGRKTTIIAFVVTLVFILSFVPHLCLQVAHLIWKGFDEELEGAELAVYNIFLRSYFINNVANPIIYGLMNAKFRKELKLTVNKLVCWRKKTM